jgi:hypothetical protein
MLSSSSASNRSSPPFPLKLILQIFPVALRRKFNSHHFYSPTTTPTHSTWSWLQFQFQQLAWVSGNILITVKACRMPMMSCLNFVNIIHIGVAADIWQGSECFWPSLYISSTLVRSRMFQLPSLRGNVV